MRRLYVQIYLAVVGVGLLCLGVSGGMALLLWEAPGMAPIQAASIAIEAASAPIDALPVALDAVQDEFDVELTVFDPQGRMLASTGHPLPFGRAGWFRRFGTLGMRTDLADGRVLAVGHHRHPGHLPGLTWLIGIGAAVALGSYPVARRITRRLEGVQDGVRRWGAGDLSVRVPVEGRDEVADVAATFNEAAAQVQALFEAQRRVLASASHELRSPLARLRVALELVADGVGGQDWLASAVHEIEELDATVEDLLQVGRMQALAGPEGVVEVDLSMLLATEGAHVGATVTGPRTMARVHPRLIRIAVRNLLENAARHGAPPIEARTRVDGFEVSDRGPGLPDGQVDRVFEPFHRRSDHTEGRDGGVGLGLHLVREIVRHHGGEVVASARADGGTRFRVRLDGCYAAP